MLRIMTVDDEPVAVRRLVALLRPLDDVTVVATAHSSQAAIELAQVHRPDLALLDIEMPGLSGIGLAGQLRGLERPTAIVFVTAYSRFALDAFDLDARDYLVKPVEPARLREAVERVRRHLSDEAAASRVDELEHVVRQLRVLEREDDFDAGALWLSDFHGRHRVRTTDILWMEAERDYVRVHVSDHSYLVRGRFGEFASRFEKQGLLRVHRSALVRSSAVVRIEYCGDRSYRLVLVNGAVINASRRFASVVRNRIGRAEVTAGTLP